MNELVSDEANVKAHREAASEPNPVLMEYFAECGRRVRARMEYWLLTGAGWVGVECKSCGGIGTKDGKTCHAMQAEEMMGWPSCPDCKGHGSWMQDGHGNQKDYDGEDIHLPKARTRPIGEEPRGKVEREER